MKTLNTIKDQDKKTKKEAIKEALRLVSKGIFMF